MATTEAIQIPGAISGSAIIEDVCDRIAEQLARSCDLRPIDVYRGYSVRATVEIQLFDVYDATVNATVNVGSIDAAAPVQTITIGGDMEGQQDQPLGEGLERPVDPAGVSESPAAQKRQYVSRIRGQH